MENTLLVEVIQNADDKWTKRAENLLTLAESCRVVDVASMDLAAVFVRQIDGEIKAVKETFGLPKERAHQAHKAMCEAEKKHLGERESVKRIVKGKIGAYQTEQERERREEQARLQREAQRQADEEALRRAEALEADGRKAEAEAVISAPVRAPIMPAPPPPPTPAGVQTRVYWRFEIVRTADVPRDYLKIDEVKLASYARSMKGAANLSGVRFYSERY